MGNVPNNTKLALTFVTMTTACGSSPHSYEIRAWGEAFAEEQIPASEVSDGWTIELDELVVAIGEIAVEADESLELEGWYVFDLSAPSRGVGQILAEVETTGPMSGLRYRMGRVRGEVVGGNATQGQVEALVMGGYGLHVRGRGRRGEEEIGFVWDFPLEYGHRCALGQSIATPRPAGPTITIHADHLFLDDLEHHPSIAFDAIAQADVDGSGFVDADELAAFDITGLGRYQSGSAEIRDLWSYIGALAGTLGHIDGEGGCTPFYTPREYVGLGVAEGPQAGEAVYATHCASCHGESGLGDGVAATGWPAPTNLTRLSLSALEPDYLLYRIREGGGFFPFASTMGAYEGVLSEEEERALIGLLIEWNR